MIDEVIDYLDQSVRNKAKKQLVEDITGIIVFLEQIAPTRIKAILPTIDSVKNNLKTYITNIQRFIEPRDKTRVAEFYRLSVDIVKQMQTHMSNIETGYDYPISDNYIPLSEKLVKLSEDIISCE